MSRITHFDIPSDDPKRAQKFYNQVFGWKFKKWDGPTDYWIVTTGTKEPGINGGLSKRIPGQMGMTNTITVTSINKFSKKNHGKRWANDYSQNGNSQSRVVCTMYGY